MQASVAFYVVLESGSATESLFTTVVSHRRIDKFARIQSSSAVCARARSYVPAGAARSHARACVSDHHRTGIFRKAGEGRGGGEGESAEISPAESHETGRGTVERAGLVPANQLEIPRNANLRVHRRSDRSPNEGAGGGEEWGEKAKKNTEERKGKDRVSRRGKLAFRGERARTASCFSRSENPAAR